MEAKTRKSELTRSAIVDTGLEIAMKVGLEALTIQSVADKLHMSKSGVFSRVESVDSLRLAVVEEFGRQFLADVFLPAMQQPKGRPRLDTIMERWIDRVVSIDTVGRMLLESSIFSLNLRDVLLYEATMRAVNAWRGTLRRMVVQCIDAGQLRQTINADDLIFELRCVVLGVLYDHLLLKDTKVSARGIAAYRRLMEDYSPTQDGAGVAAAVPV